MPYFKPKSKILELGAGAGWQAAHLNSLGFDVCPIDVESSNYLDQKVYDILLYDGKKIPYPDGFFDYVFSSNVLEHVDNINDFNLEIYRVLKTNGTAIHILPTSSWRIWTSLTHYIYVLIKAIRLLQQNNEKVTLEDSGNEIFENAPVTKKIKIAINHIFPPRHGERGNFISEAYYFSELYWKSKFRMAGFKIKDVLPNKIFYTGHSIMDDHLTLKFRKQISQLIGSSCKIYILYKT